MQIVIDTTNPLSDTDRRILRLLLGSPGPSEEAAGPEARTDTEKPSETPSEAGDPTGTDSELLDEAIKKATDLIKDKQGDRVRAALEAAGVKKVTHLDNDEALRTFLDAL